MLGAAWQEECVGMQSCTPCNSLITQSRVISTALQSLINRYKALPSPSSCGRGMRGPSGGGQCSLLLCFQNLAQDLAELCLGLSSQSGDAVGIVEISLFNRLRFLWSFIRLS